MSDLKYNFLGDNFLVFKDTENPKVEFNLPLYHNDDISEWADYQTESGDIKVKPDSELNQEQWVFNNPEYVPQQEVQLEQSPTKQNTQKTIQQNSTQSTKKLVSSTLNKDQQKTALQLMNGLINRKINPIVASGIIGNLVGESGHNLNTSAYNSNDVGAPAGGLAGWRGDNLTKLKKFAQNRGKKWTDLDTQLDYLVGTISTDVSNRLSKATNPFEASEAWAYYERYAGYNNSIETARKFQRSQGWSDQKTKNWIANQHKKRGDMSTEIYNLWLANQ